MGNKNNRELHVKNQREQLKHLQLQERLMKNLKKHSSSSKKNLRLDEYYYKVCRNHDTGNAIVNISLLAHLLV